VPDIDETTFEGHWEQGDWGKGKFEQDDLTKPKREGDFLIPKFHLV